MNFKCLFLSLLISTPFSFSLTPTKHYGYTYDSEYKDYSVAGKGSVSYELQEMGYNLYEFNESYQKDEELITCTQSFDSNNSLHTYVYIFTKDVTIEYVDITISTSLDRDEEGNYNENSRSYPLLLVSYNKDNTLRKYEVMDLSLNTYVRRLAVSKINSLKYTDENIKEYSIINVSMCYLFRGLNNDELESYYEGLDTLVITDHEMGTFLSGKKLIDNDFSYGINRCDDVWYYFFNTNIDIDSIIDLSIEYYKIKYLVHEIFPANVVPREEMILSSIDNNSNNIILTPNPSGSGFITAKPYIQYLKTDDNNAFVDIISSNDFNIITNSYWWDIFKMFEEHKKIESIIDLSNYEFNEYLNFDFKDFSNYRWGVQFLITERTVAKTNPDNYTSGYLPYSSSILRIKFYKDGEIHNMNVVDTRIDASFAVDARTDLFANNKELLIIIIIIVCILLLGAIASFITPVWNVVVTVGKFIWKAIVFIFKLITWPLKFLFTGDKSFW